MAYSLSRGLDRGYVPECLGQRLFLGAPRQPKLDEAIQLRRTNTAITEGEEVHEDVGVGVELLALAFLPDQRRIVAGIQDLL